MSKKMPSMPLPTIVGELDQLKALQFASALCGRAFLTEKDSTLAHNARQVRDMLGGILETARKLETSAIERIELMETMLRKDGLAVLVYLEVGAVRAHLRLSGHSELDATLTDEAIGVQLVTVLNAAGDYPRELSAFRKAIEQKAAHALIAQVLA